MNGPDENEIPLHKKLSLRWHSADVGQNQLHGGGHDVRRDEENAFYVAAIGESPAGVRDDRYGAVGRGEGVREPEQRKTPKVSAGMCGCNLRSFCGMGSAINYRSTFPCCLFNHHLLRRAFANANKINSRRLRRKIDRQISFCFGGEDHFCQHVFYTDWN